ncbi:MAG: hypothetical protein QUS35_04140 [bacterium]|nr:hypothetical protein [bacterium]
MKRPFRTLMITAFVLAGLTGAWPHPASAVKLEYDSASRILKIIAAHETKKPAEHYIQSVVVRLNGKEIVRQVFASQEDVTALTVSYKVFDAKPGDTVEVTTVCNVFGKKKESIRL